MKISKTRVGIAVVTVVLAVGCVAGAGCAAQQPEPSNAVAGTETTPKLMPAQHQKYVDRTAYKCYRCHGASVQGNPTAKKCGCHAEWPLHEQRPVDIRARPHSQ